jgi:hypothetical protein
MLSECVMIERNFDPWNGTALRKVIEIEIIMWHHQEDDQMDPESGWRA